MNVSGNDREVLTRIDKVEITNDTNHLEFKTDPLDSEAQVEGAINVMVSFVTCARRLLAEETEKEKKEKKEKEEKGEKGEEEEKGEVKVAISDVCLLMGSADAAKPDGAHVPAPASSHTITARGGWSARPQVSAGVRLQNLREFIDRVTTIELTGYKENLTKRREQLKRESTSRALDDPERGILNNLEERKEDYFLAHRPELFHRAAAAASAAAPRSMELQGLLALVASYIRQGRGQETATRSAKVNFGLMARTDFRSMYLSLPEDQKKEFPDAWEILLQKLNEKSSERIFNRGITIPNGLSEELLEGPTIHEWMDSIRNQGNSAKDAMSPPTQVPSDQSMGAMSLDGDLVVLELRSLPRINQPVDVWLDTALTAFRFVQGVASGGCGGNECPENL